ncbi:MAG TPA: transcriptional regulator, partial [Nitrospinaceae bacterium]|nr:transcriptional regulator [Nitrospinaceae bacterium]
MKKKKPINIKDRGERSKCPMTNTLDLIGDKWTLLVIRDMIFFGRKQFRDFLDSPEGISTNILTERLKRLEKHGIIEKHSYQDNPVRYEYSLTQIGQDLEPVLLEIN